MTTMYKQNKINCDYRYFNLKIICTEDRKRSCKASLAMEMSVNNLSTHAHPHMHTLEWRKKFCQHFHLFARSHSRTPTYICNPSCSLSLFLFVLLLFDFKIFRLQFQHGMRSKWNNYVCFFIVMLSWLFFFAFIRLNKLDGLE